MTKRRRCRLLDRCVLCAARFEDCASGAQRFQAQKDLEPVQHGQAADKVAEGHDGAALDEARAQAGRNLQSLVQEGAYQGEDQSHLHQPGGRQIAQAGLDLQRPFADPVRQPGCAP